MGKITSQELLLDSNSRFDVDIEGNVSGKTLTGTLPYTEKTNIPTAMAELVTANGYRTSNPAADTMPEYTKIASITLNVQYAEASTMLIALGDGSGLATDSKALIKFRVKQQVAMGGAPIVNVEVSNWMGLSPSDFIAVTTANTAGQTTVELYFKLVTQYLGLRFTPLLKVQASLITFYDTAGKITSLPAGTQTIGSFKDDGFYGSLVSNGYQKLPNGLIIQWMTIGPGSLPANTTTNGTATFPIAFPNGALNVQLSCKPLTTYDFSNLGHSILTNTTTQWSVKNGATVQSFNIHLLVIGY